MRPPAVSPPRTRSRSPRVRRSAAGRSIATAVCMSLLPRAIAYPALLIARWRCWESSVSPPVALAAGAAASGALLPPVGAVGAHAAAADRPGRPALDRVRARGVAPGGVLRGRAAARRTSGGDPARRGTLGRGRGHGDRDICAHTAPPGPRDASRRVPAQRTWVGALAAQRRAHDRPARRCSWVSRSARSRWRCRPSPSVTAPGRSPVSRSRRSRPGASSAGS